MKLMQKLGTINNWYHKFEHIDIEAICNLYKKELVLDLKLIGQLQIAKAYKDCIFGKAYMKSYDEEIMHEKKILE